MDAAELLSRLVVGMPVPDDSRFRPVLPCDPMENIGWCKLAWALGCQSLNRANEVGPVEALRGVISQGGDTDTNGAVAGALLGASFGATAWDGWATKGLAEAARCRTLAARLSGES